MVYILYEKDAGVFSLCNVYCINKENYLNKDASTKNLLFCIMIIIMHESYDYIIYDLSLLIDILKSCRLNVHLLYFYVPYTYPSFK